MTLTRRTLVAALGAAALAAPFAATAQGGYPSKPIRVIVPFAAGSTTDIIARAIADKMSASMGQQLVIDNRGGVDPLQLYVSIAGLSYFYLSNSYTLSAIFGRDLLATKAKNERLTHMCDVILGYVLRS